MDFVFIGSGLILMLIGIIGSILPILPGVPISWLGLVALYFAPSLPFDTVFISITGIVALGLYALDYIIPAYGTKKFGGSKAGVWGTTIGLFVGMISPIPFGFLLGAFSGAYIGETVFNNTASPVALKASMGSFIGFLGSTFIKFTATLIYLGMFVYQLSIHRELLFGI